MKTPVFRKEKEIETPIMTESHNGNGKIDKNTTIYTGNKSKQLFVHVMQNGVEVDKPIKTKIYEQKVSWRMRDYPIVPSRFYYDYSGVAHQQVDVNDVSVLTFHKDHTDTCVKCGAKMTVDAKQSRMLGRRGVFTAIWGLDNTHTILLIVMAIGAMAMAGGFFWAYNQNTLHETQLKSVQEKYIALDKEVHPEKYVDDGNTKNPDGSSSVNQRK